MKKTLLIWATVFFGLLLFFSVLAGMATLMIWLVDTYQGWGVVAVLVSILFVASGLATFALPYTYLPPPKE